jgi:hypothetical protein
MYTEKMGPVKVLLPVISVFFFLFVFSLVDVPGDGYIGPVALEDLLVGAERVEVALRKLAAHGGMIVSVVVPNV